LGICKATAITEADKVAKYLTTVLESHHSSVSFINILITHEVAAAGEISKKNREKFRFCWDFTEEQ
jgi:hypothetical protein